MAMLSFLRDAPQKLKDDMEATRQAALMADDAFRCAEKAHEYFASDEWRKACMTVFYPEADRLARAHANTDLRDEQGNPNTERLAMIKGQRNQCLLFIGMENTTKADLEKTAKARIETAALLERAEKKYRNARPDNQQQKVA